MADVHIWGTMAHTSTILARRPSTHKRRDGRQPERDGSYTLGVGGTCTRRRRRRQRDRTWRRRHLLPFFLLLLPFPFFFSFFFLPPPSSTYLLLLCSLTSARGRAPHGQTNGQGPGGLPRGQLQGSGRGRAGRTGPDAQGQGRAGGAAPPSRATSSKPSRFFIIASTCDNTTPRQVS